MSDSEDVRPIGLILDTSAVLAFAGGAMQVHEPILLAEEAKQDVAVPLVCVVEAVRRNPGGDFRELIHHPLIRIVMPDQTDADLLLDWTLYYAGREDLAAAAVISYRHGRCVVLTAEPDAYAIADNRPHWVVAIDEGW